MLTFYILILYFVCPWLNLVLLLLWLYNNYGDSSMKKKLLGYCINVIKNKYPDYDEDKIEIINYGLESIYLTFSKIILILGVSILLGIFKKVILLLVFYNIIRFTAFGMHAKKSWHCLLLSSIMFIGGVYICEYVYFSLLIKVILTLVCIFLIFKYAPADTEKRPLINKKRRKKYKTFSVLSAGIFTMLIVIFNEYLISSYLLFGMIFATFMILPISYKLFDLPYDNYKRYKLNEV